MTSFVAIKTVYKNTEDRNFGYLSSVYHNDSYLLEIISALINTNISDREINNKKVLLKPNWVRHNLNAQDEICLRTNEYFILSVVEVVLSKKPKSIVIADAPIQGCNWQAMLPAFFYQRIENFLTNVEYL